MNNSLPWLQRRNVLLAVFLAQLCGLASSVWATSISSLYRQRSFVQSGSAAPTLESDPTTDESQVRWEFSLSPLSPVDSLRVEYGASESVTFSAGVTALDAADGPFRLIARQNGQDLPDVSVTLAGPNFPPAPRLRNISQLTTQGSGTEYLVSWDAFEGGTTNDFVVVHYDSFSAREDLLDSLVPPGRSNALDGTATSVIIPASLNSTNQIRITFLKVSDQKTNSNGVLVGLAGYASQTRIGFASQPKPPAPNTNAPALTEHYPENGDDLVSSYASSDFYFCFDQPMQEGISIGWSSNVDPALWTYEWNAGGDRTCLYCSYEERLPGNELITWTLNPSGSGMPRLAGTNGVEVPSGFYSGSFRTVVVGSTNIWYAIASVSRSFTQESGADPVEESHSPTHAGYSSGLVGEPTTVAIATLQLPDDSLLESWGGGTQGVDGFETDVEQFFALQDEFPDGEYLVTYEFEEGQVATVGFKVDLSAELPPPRIVNLTEAQSIDPAKDFVLRWEATPGNQYDYQELQVSRDEGFGGCAEGSWGSLELAASARELQIPAGSLLPGHTYECSLYLSREVEIETSTRPPGTGYDGAFLDCDHTVVFTIQTVGDPCAIRELAVASQALASNPGQALSRQLEAMGGVPPYQWELVHGSMLPLGVTLTAEGKVMGTPQEQGVFDFAARVRDSASTALDSETGASGVGTFRLTVGSTTPVLPVVAIRSEIGGPLVISFPTVAGRTYRLDSISDLDSSWSTVETFTGDGALREFPITPTIADFYNFYRVTAQ